METIKQCMIEGCLDEVKFTSKLSGKIYYSCKRHEQEMAHIVAAEHTKEEMERTKKKHLFSLTDDKNKNPKWMKI